MMHFENNQLKFSMKLLLDKNIVMVECPGREPQLFMPVFLDNSIVLQNIIFDNNAPLPHRIRPKLPILKVATSSNVKMTTAYSHAANSKSKHKRQSANTLVPIKKNCSRWVRSGTYAPDATAAKLGHLDDPTLPVAGPTPATSAAGKQLKLRLKKAPATIGAKAASSFDTVRGLFYSNCKQTAASKMPAVIKLPTLKK